MYASLVYRKYTVVAKIYSQFDDACIKWSFHSYILLLKYYTL